MKLHTDLATLPTSELRALRSQLARDLEETDAQRARSDAEAIRDRCKSFSNFVKEAWHVIEPGTKLKWNWHLEAMCRHLEAITHGEMTPWLIINVPPGSSKSTIVSVLWQAWEWGPLGLRHHRFVSTSFEEGNVKRDTRKTRNLIQSQWYQALWPEVVMIRSGETSFENSATGTREGVTFSAVTGKRGDRVIIDDPHSLRGAESEADRTRATREFLEGGLNRTNDAEKSAMVIVMQRLHEGDLTGVLLARDLGFVHLCIPMEFEPARRFTTPINWTDPRSYDGELMDPGRFPATSVERQKKAGEYSWAGQYQQRPAPREGGMFKVDLIGIVDSCPPGGSTVAGWDLAGSKRKSSPYTARVLMTRIGGDIYVRHVARKHTNPTETERMIETLSVEDRNRVPDLLISVPQDPGFGGKAFKWRVSEILMGFNYRSTPETGAKETRAEPFAAQVGAERVFLVRGDWNAEYIEELRNFPGGSLKDQVDASSRAFQELVGLVPVAINAAPELLDENGSDYVDTYEGDPWGA